MKILIKELVDKAMIACFDSNTNESTKKEYYSKYFKPILSMYEKEDIKIYNESFNNTLREMYISQCSSNLISRSTLNRRIRGLEILKEVYETGNFKWKVVKKYRNLISNNFTDSIDSYLKTRNLCDRNIDFEKKCLDEFSIFLCDREIMIPGDITTDGILSFIKHKSLSCSKSMDKIGTAISKYIRYLYDTKMIENDYSFIVKVKSNRDKKVRRAAKSDDIISVLESIDRSSSIGKRDYAIILLSCMTGLRAGDIASLELSDIDWKRMELSIIQGKTNIRLVLPIDRNVCNVLADYILNSRPKTNCTRLFIRSLAPYAGFHDGVSLNSMLRRRLSNAGIIKKNGDGNTFHGIRRMIGTEMINKSYPVDTVAQILGHQSIRPTRQYISLDYNGLKKCALSFDSLGDQS